MENFFFWFGVVSFCIVSLLILGVLINFGPEWVNDSYRFLYKSYLKRNDKPNFEIGDLVIWEGEEYKIHDRYYQDMNGDYNFKWLYRIQITHSNYQRSWEEDRSTALVYESNIERSKRAIRTEGIDKILSEN